VSRALADRRMPPPDLIDSAYLRPALTRGHDRSADRRPRSIGHSGLFLLRCWARLLLAPPGCQGPLRGGGQHLFLDSGGAGDGRQRRFRSGWHPLPAARLALSQSAIRQPVRHLRMSRKTLLILASRRRRHPPDAWWKRRKAQLLACTPESLVRARPPGSDAHVICRNTFEPAAAPSSARRRADLLEARSALAITIAFWLSRSTRRWGTDADQPAGPTLVDCRLLDHTAALYGTSWPGLGAAAARISSAVRVAFPKIPSTAPAGTWGRAVRITASRSRHVLT